LDRPVAGSQPIFAMIAVTTVRNVKGIPVGTTDTFGKRE
jgi:hypothetical protein